MQQVRHWTRQKITRPLAAMSAWDRATCLLVGVLGGLFPVPMVTTAVTVALCAMLGLSAVQSGVATAVNFALTPAQLFMIPVFANLCAVVLRQPADFTVETVKSKLNEGFAAIVTNAASMLVFASVTWALLCAIAIGFLLALRKNGRERAGL